MRVRIGGALVRVLGSRNPPFAFSMRKTVIHACAIVFAIRTAATPAYQRKTGLSQSSNAIRSPLVSRSVPGMSVTRNGDFDPCVMDYAHTIVAAAVPRS
jgi:hypothetical protein